MAVSKASTCRLRPLHRWLLQIITLAIAAGTTLSFTFTVTGKPSRTARIRTSPHLYSSLTASAVDKKKRVEDRPHGQRTQGPRPARRLNHSFRYLYRHGFNLTVTDPAQYLIQEGGYTETQVYAMNASFPPLLTLSVQRHLHPKMRFLVETLGASPGSLEVPPQYFGARLERTLAPRHAFLVFSGLPHGRALLDTPSSTSGSSNTNTTLVHDFLMACRKTKRFAALCQSWQRTHGQQTTPFASEDSAISAQRIEAFDALFARGLMSAARDELVQSNNTWPTDHVNISSSQLIRLLVQHGAAVHERDYRGVSLLHWAAGAGNVEGMQELLPHFKESVWTVTERDGATPLHWAVAGSTAREFGTGGHIDVCRALLEQVRVVDRKRYVNQLTLDGNSPLMWASWSGTLETVKLLVRNRADTTVVNRNGCSVAHWAASGGNVEACRYLAETAGVDFSQPNKGGNTPLTHAVAFGRADVVEWLRKEVVDADDGVAYSLAQDFVHWTDGDKQRTQVLQLFDEWNEVVGEEASSDEFADFADF